MNNISISDNDPDGALSREGPTSNAEQIRSFLEGESALGIGLNIPTLVKQAKSFKPVNKDFPVKSATGR